METISDQELITKIKENNCSDSLQELSNRHAALCYGVYRRYAPTISASGLCINDLCDEKEYVVYQAVMSYNPEKKTKFSSWLSSNLRYQCLNAINNNGEYIAVEDKKLYNFIDQKQQEEPKADNSLIDYTLEIFSQLKDQRIKQIFILRYLNGQRGYTWKQIGDELNLSAQTVINLHAKGKKILQEKLKNNLTLDLI